MSGLVDTVEATLDDLRELEIGSRRLGVRTNILDLVVVCDDAEMAAQMSEVVATLPHSQPSRAIVGLAHEAPQEPEFDARVFCRRQESAEASPDEEQQVCSDLVTLTVGDQGAALPSLVASLLLPDLPVFLLWQSQIPFSSPLCDQLWPIVTRVVADSTNQKGALGQLHELVRRTPSRDVTDLSWTKITGWREAVARAFDTPENAACLADLDRIDIRHVGESMAQARLLAGWLQGRTKRRVHVAIESERRADMRSGSLTSVEITCGAEQFRVTRVDEGIGRVEAPRIAHHNVALRVPPLRELVAEELNVLERDWTFEEALSWLPPEH